MQQAITILDETGLSQDFGGNTRDSLQELLNEMRQGGTLGQASRTAIWTGELLQQIIDITIDAITTTQDHHDVWYEKVIDILQTFQQQESKAQIEIDFLTAVLGLLEGQAASLPESHPYAPAFAQILDGIIAHKEAKNDFSFDSLIARSILALQSEPRKKIEHMQYLREMDAQATDEQLRTLLRTIQLALLDGDLTQLGQNLDGDFLQVWKRIVTSVKTSGIG